MNKLITIYLLTCFLGCSTVKKWEDNNYTKVHLKELKIVEDSLYGCRVQVFKKRENDKQLNGNYWIIHSKNTSEFSSFSEGLYNDKKYVLWKKEQVEEIEFKMGVRDGLYVSINPFNRKLIDSINFKDGMRNGYYSQYVDGFLKRNSNYKNGVKDGKEYFYNKKREIVNVSTYELDTTYTESDYFDNYSGLYFKEDAPFMGRLKVEVSNPQYAESSYFVSTVGHDLDCRFKGIYLIAVNGEDYISYCTSSGCDLYSAEKRE